MTLTRRDFLADRTGRTFTDVVNDPALDFDAWLDFFNDRVRQQRMVDAEVARHRPALAGVVEELETHAAFRPYLCQSDVRNTYRGRQAVGVILRMVMEGLGWHKTSRKGRLPVARWFTRAERYEPVGGPLDRG